MDDVQETKPQINTPPVAATPAALSVALDVERQFREREPAACFVMSRVVRRVLQDQLGITSPWVPPPHRESCVISRDRLFWLASKDELGIARDVPLPQRLMLIARPEPDELARFTRDALLRYYWRHLFHARIDFELEPRTSAVQMPLADLRQRIAQLGQTQFDEIRSVLQTEQRLRKPDDLRQVYAEFVAVYHELRVFAPELVPLYFPSLAVPDEVLKVIGQDCDADAVLEATRPPELANAEPTLRPVPPPTTAEALLEQVAESTSRIAPRRCDALVRRAELLRQKGNNVRAALTLRRALDVSPIERRDEIRLRLLGEVELLVYRLQTALELSPEKVAPWRAMCERLLPAARRGFFNANARLLYDLQQVCLDHEQEIYRVDLWDWLISRGKRPLKRPLPNQRVVLMSKHLRSAAQRVSTVLIDDAGRRELGELLHAAADAARRILRKRFEPIVEESLTKARFIPQNVVERVAFRKVTHELLDGVVQRGFLTLGDLRDAISRNQIKMTDLQSFQEFREGDPLLTADRLFATRLEGVYERGPFYLCWLQRANSLAFGLPWCRLVTKYVALPFGLAFLALMAVEELAHLLHHPPPPPPPDPTIAAVDAVVPPTPGAHPRHYLVYGHWRMFWLGCLFAALIHLPRFRDAVFLVLRRTWKLLRIAVVEIPQRIAAFPIVAWLQSSFPMLLFRRFLLLPLVLSAAFIWLLPALGAYSPIEGWWRIPVFLAAMVLLNSRIGRDTGELTREFIGRTWYRIRVHLLVGLVTLIIDTVRWLMDGVERILYAVGEWLRFRGGQSQLTLGIKAVLGLVWMVVNGVIRFCITLLIEPQINPIKHFPVVTVSHKLVLTTLSLPLVNVLEKLHYDHASAITLTGLILSGIPGIFGFLAWELKENWRLYAANRPRTLRPVLVGHHGESLRRLLSPGFHSGTIPKLFARRRKAARQTAELVDQRIDKQAWYTERLHHEAEAVRHFVERELIALLKESRTFRDRSLHVGSVELATNRIRVSIEDHHLPGEPVVIQVCEQSGWLIASVCDLGWLGELVEEDRNVFRAALAGLYKYGRVGLVREQVESGLVTSMLGGSGNSNYARQSPWSKSTRQDLPYDVAPIGLIVWPKGDYTTEIHFALDEGPTAVPRPRSLARNVGLTPVPLETLVFQEHPLNWDDWRDYWDTEQNSGAIPRRLLPDVDLLSHS